MKKIILILMTFGLLLAEVDQKEVLMNEANRYTLRRQYEKAIVLYEKLLEDYPDDPQIGEKLIENYLYTNRLSEADETLQSLMSDFSELNYVKLKLAVLLSGSELKEAKKLSDRFLTDNFSKVNNYKIIASVFQRYRQYEQSIDVLKKGRNLTKDEYLFTSEMANNYYQIKDFSNSIREYLKHVSRNKAYNHYVQNKIKIILQEDSLQINAVRDFAESVDTDLIKEIYAVSLGEIGEFDSALEIYRKLDPEKLLKYADNLKKSAQQEQALQAYNIYRDMIESPVLLAEVDIKLAEVYFSNRDYDTAEIFLKRVYDSEEIKERKLKYKTRANRVCREMLSEIALINKENEKVVPLLDEASQFTYNQREKQELNFKIIDFTLMTSDFEKAESELAKMLKDEDTASDIYKKGFYYKYLLAVMTGSAAGDSLLGELIINLFFAAVRNRRLYNGTKAVDEVVELFDNTGNEQFLLLAGDWALQYDDHTRATQIFSHEFQDEDFKQYALLQNTLLHNNSDLQNKAAKEFLTHNPKSIFSPEFRKIFTEK